MKYIKYNLTTRPFNNKIAPISDMRPLIECKKKRLCLKKLNK